MPQPTHLVTARHPITLDSGAPAAPGDKVHSGRDQDLALKRNGGLTPLPDPKPAPSAQTATSEGQTTTSRRRRRPTEED